MIDIVSLILVALTTARVTRLITTDVVFNEPRSKILGLLLLGGDHTRLATLRNSLAYLIVCDWCVSVYVGAAAMSAWALWGETMWFAVCSGALSASYVAGFLSSKGGTD